MKPETLASHASDFIRTLDRVPMRYRYISETIEARRYAYVAWDNAETAAMGSTLAARAALVNAGIAALHHAVLCYFAGMGRCMDRHNTQGFPAVSDRVRYAIGGAMAAMPAAERTRAEASIFSPLAQ